MLGRAQGAWSSQLGGRDDPALGPAAHTAGAEGDALVETILEFRPGRPGDEVGQGGEVGGGQGPGLDPAAGLAEGGGGKMALGVGGPESGK